MVARVAPVNGAPFFNHWYVIGAVPATPAEKVAVFPALVPTLTGWVVMKD